MGLLSWLLGTPTRARVEEPIVCSSCGRHDLPEAGGWDPPICVECDAAINFDAIEEQELFDELRD